MKQFVLNITAITAFLGLLGSPLANAQSEAVKAAREAVIENLADIKEIDTTELSREEKAAKELELKKTAFANLLSLSILETDDVLTNLRKLKLEGQNREFIPLRDGLVAKLVGYEKYFGALREVLGATEDMGGIRELAGQFEAKRESSYNTDIKTSIEMLVTFHVEGVLITAYERLDKLTTAVKRAKGTKGENLIRANLLRDAATRLGHARATAILARERLVLYTLPLPEIDAAATMIAEEVHAVETLPEPTIYELAEQSIAEIKEAYNRDFIELTESLNKKSSR